MESDATALQNALAVLREQFGEQLAGPRHAAQAQMRQALQQRMGLDEGTADKLVKKLSDTGKLEYVGSAEVGTEPGTTTTGPVISMPSTATSGGAPIITTASPATIMGIVNEPGGGDVEASEVGAAASDLPITGAGAVSTDPIRGGDVGRNLAENNQGPTMGQLGDTNVEAAPAPITRGEHEEAESDRTHGYWRIG